MKKVSWIVVIAGAVVGLAAVVLTHLGNPANMGFCNPATTASSAAWSTTPSCVPCCGCLA